MKLLAFDTSTPASTVGLLLDDGTVLGGRDDPGPGERPGHATRLLGLADGLLREAGVSFEQLERIGVGVGPGTFTGLRIGVASARGLAQSLAVELVGFSSLAALAEPLRAEDRPVVSIIDARRGEIFLAAYRCGVQLLDPRAIRPQLAGEVIEQAGLAQMPPLAVGDGAIRYRSLLEEFGLEVPDDASPLHLIGAEAICRLSAAAPSEPMSAIMPEYCRRADAEIALEGAER